MKFTNLLYGCGILLMIWFFSVTGSGCAQIGMPTGGDKDTLPPQLVSASPAPNSTKFTGNKITLTFNEYIEIKDVQTNVLVSPYPKYTPNISNKLKTITIRLKDTLQPNTTYAINFGNSITDINEGNVFKNYTYVFSTGRFIDTLTFSGRVTLAETGKADSTMIAMLYRNANDSSVRTRKPDYIARIDADGDFTFTNLPEGKFSFYALLDGDGSKTYNSKFETFAFSKDEIMVNANTKSDSILAYAEEKEVKDPPAAGNRTVEKKLKYLTSLGNENQSLLSDLSISFNKPLKDFDAGKIIVTDTNYVPVAGIVPQLDTSRKLVTIKAKWPEDTKFRLIIDAAVGKDTAGNALAKSDTIRFVTKKERDYGSIILRFKNLDLAKHPVLLFVQNDGLKYSYPLTTNEWSQKLFESGEYELRILFDDNNNGKWDPGNFAQKRQPEKVIAVPQKVSIKMNWDNEKEIVF